jgi:dTDP-4-amino-4,6-dideoxygalactose transaminase
MAALEGLAEAAGVRLVADAAAAFGARVDGRRVGGFGDAEVFSFSGTKVLTAGEGGVVCTRDSAMAARMRQVARYGVNADYCCEFNGINGKMGELSAALALLSLPRLDGWLEERRAAVARYRTLLAGVSQVRMQEPVCNGTWGTWKDLALVLPSREDAARVVRRARAHRVDTRPYYRPLHAMPAFAGWRRGALHVTEALADCVVCVPLYAGMRDEVIELVAGVVADALDHAD